MKTKSKVNETGNYTKPTLRKRLFEKILAGDKGGEEKSMVCQKSVDLAREYENQGGGYKTKK